MTNEELVAYCRSHSRTERALFSGSMVREMCVLAGWKTPKSITDDGFYTIYSDEMDPLCEAAERATR